MVAVDRNATSAAATIASLEKCLFGLHKEVYVARGKAHISLEMDVSSSESISTALDKIIAEFRKPPTIVVNSAGIAKDNYLLKMSEHDFDDVIDVNLQVNHRIIENFYCKKVDWFLFRRERS